MTQHGAREASQSTGFTVQGVDQEQALLLGFEIIANHKSPTGKEDSYIVENTSEGWRG